MSLRTILEELVGKTTKTLYEGSSGNDMWGLDQSEQKIKGLMMTEEEIGEFIRKNCSKYLIEEAYSYSIATALHSAMVEKMSNPSLLK